MCTHCFQSSHWKRRWSIQIRKSRFQTECIQALSKRRKQVKFWNPRWAENIWDNPTLIHHVKIHICFRRVFTTAGVAAGVAAAFNAPIGGLLFAMEDLSTFWNRTLSWQTFFCSGVAACIANVINTAFNAFSYQGNFGLFSLAVRKQKNWIRSRITSCMSC